MKSFWPFGLAIASGLLLTASFPPFNFYPLGWIALVPLFFALENKNALQGFQLVFFAFFPFFLHALFWLKVFGWYAWIGGALYEAFLSSIWGLLLPSCITRNARSSLRIVFPPLAYTAMEAFRNLGPLGMPWGDLAYSQWKWLSMIQTVSLLGTLGLSFLMALFNRLLYLALYEKSFKKVFLSSLCLFIPWIFGAWRFNSPTSFPALKISVIQTNDLQTQKWDRARYAATLEELDHLVMQAAQDKPQLIVFPETALAGYYSHDPNLQKLVHRWALLTKSYLAVGALGLKEGIPQNEVVLVDPQGNSLQTYVKIKLVPFGEYLPILFKPFRGHWHALDPIVDFKGGTQEVVFRLPNTSFSEMICFESSFGWLARKFVLRGANFLVVSTNDAWFFKTPAQDEHAVMAIFRAVETGRTVVQAGNTGISLIADPKGKVLAMKRANQQAVLTQAIPLASAFTLYDDVGDLFPYLCMELTFIVLLWRKAHGF